MNDGLVYLLNLAGAALAEANHKIAQLTQENRVLRGDSVESE